MKRTIIALAAAFLIALQVFSPVAAAALPDGGCGDTYTVHRGEWLAQIARHCGTSVSHILALNPQIWNPSLIYPGQVLQLTGTAPEPPAPPQPYPYQPYKPYYPYYGYQQYYYGGYPPQEVYSGHASVSVSTTRAGEGDSITVTVRGFPANRYIDFRVGQSGEGASAWYDGKTNSSGYASQSITIPSDADPGEYWVVHVLTTDGTKGTQAYSAKIYITD